MYHRDSESQRGRVPQMSEASTLRPSRLRPASTLRRSRNAVYEEPEAWDEAPDKVSDEASEGEFEYEFEVEPILPQVPQLPRMVPRTHAQIVAAAAANNEQLLLLEAQQPQVPGHPPDSVLFMIETAEDINKLLNYNGRGTTVEITLPSDDIIKEYVSTPHPRLDIHYIRYGDGLLSVTERLVAMAFGYQFRHRIAQRVEAIRFLSQNYDSVERTQRRVDAEKRYAALKTDQEVIRLEFVRLQSMAREEDRVDLVAPIIATPIIWSYGDIWALR